MANTTWTNWHHSVTLSGLLYPTVLQDANATIIDQQTCRVRAGDIPIYDTMVCTLLEACNVSYNFISLTPSNQHDHYGSISLQLTH